MEPKDFLSRFTPAAHRGASRQLPENTIEAFRRALEILPGCMLEIDVHRTSDGRIVVLHDDLLEAKTDGAGPVGARTLNEIRGLDAGHRITFDGGKTYPFRGRGFKIPILDEVLEAFPDSALSVDVKDDDPRAAELAVSAVTGKGAADRVVISSFHSRIIRYVRARHPRVSTSFSQADIMRFLLLQKTRLSRFYPRKGTIMFIPEFTDSENPEYLEELPHQGMRVISPGLVRAAHRKGIPVMAWTINRIENMRRLISWGADGIITDYPDLLKQVMEELGIL
jgi:glycerophosphoryl diester phosphodiesterase